MSQDEVAAIMKTRFKVKTDDIKMSWEQARMIAFYSSFDKLKIKTLQQFMPFEWDTKTEVKVLTPEEREKKLQSLLTAKNRKRG